MKKVVAEEKEHELNCRWFLANCEKIFKRRGANTRLSCMSLLTKS